MANQHYPIASERLPGESFEEYKLRRAFVNKTIRAYKKGRLVWNPKEDVELPIDNVLLDSAGKPLGSGKYRKKGPYHRKSS